MKNQVLVIHGGEVFKTYEEYLSYLSAYKIDLREQTSKKWREGLASNLGTDYEVILPHMPNKYNCRYVEWKIWFDKYIPFLRDGIIFVGYSMGGIFLAKYLSENKLSVKIKATFLVAASFDEKDSKYSLVDFSLPASLELFEKQGGAIHLYQSKDDTEVPFVDLEKYKKVLPNAKVTVFEDRGHFFQEEFPELVDDIKNLV